MKRGTLTTSSTLLALAIASTTLAGCAAQTDDAVDEAAVEALSADGTALIGSYTGSEHFRSLELTSERVGSANKFRAVVGSEFHIDGTFTATKNTITLSTMSHSMLVARFVGRYSYTVSGGKLTLKRTGFSEALTKLAAGSNRCLGRSEAECNSDLQCRPQYVPGLCTSPGCNVLLFESCLPAAPPPLGH